MPLIGAGGRSVNILGTIDGRRGSKHHRRGAKRRRNIIICQPLLLSFVWRRPMARAELINGQNEANCVRLHSAIN